MLGVAMLLLVMFNLLLGAVYIPASDVFSILCGQDVSNDSWTYIILESRLPQTVAALFCGAALAVSGLLLQTAFQNPQFGGLRRRPG